MEKALFNIHMNMVLNFLITILIFGTHFCEAADETG
jgi:hypothetical protein